MVCLVVRNPAVSNKHTVDTREGNTSNLGNEAIFADLILIYWNYLAAGAMVDFKSKWSHGSLENQQELSYSFIRSQKQELCK